MTETVAVKVDEGRAQFEAWVREEFPVWGKYLLWSESLDAYGYSTTNLMYRSWKASRAALVVEQSDFDTFSPNDCGDDAVWMREVERTLRVAGITVKGDS